MRSKKNVLRHEFIGLECEVVDSRNKSQIGIRGKIVDETRNTFLLETARGLKRIEKEGRTFRLWLEDGSVVDVNGSYLVSRPEDRIKKRIKKW